MSREDFCFTLEIEGVENLVSINSDTGQVKLNSKSDASPKIKIASDNCNLKELFGGNSIYYKKFLRELLDNKSLFELVVLKYPHSLEAFKDVYDGEIRSLNERLSYFRPGAKLENTSSLVFIDGFGDQISFDIKFILEKEAHSASEVFDIRYSELDYVPTDAYVSKPDANVDTLGSTG